MALKILHTADWHLGLRFQAFDGEDESKLTRARLDVVDRILGAAEMFQVDAVLCAGDIFDQPNPVASWWKGLLEKLQRRQWRDRPLILLPGNHDPLTTVSVYHTSHPFRQALPPWVHVVDQNNWTFQINSESVLIASPCCSAAGDRDLSLELPAREPGDERIRIGMVHGQTFDIAGYQTNFPISDKAVVERGFDYLAIGDTHSFRNVTPYSAPTVYPGAPEATRFSDQDAGCVAIVYFPRGRRKPRIARQPVGHWTWREQLCRNLDELRSTRHIPQLAQTVMRLVLDMTVSAVELDEVEQILDALKGSLAHHGLVGALQIDRAALRIRLPEAEELPTEMPEFIEQVFAKLRSAEDTRLAARAIHHLCQLVKEKR